MPPVSFVKPPGPDRLALAVPSLSWKALAVTLPPVTLLPESTNSVPPAKNTPLGSTVRVPPPVTLAPFITERTPVGPNGYLSAVADSERAAICDEVTFTTLAVPMIASTVLSG